MDKHVLKYALQFQLHHLNINSTVQAGLTLSTINPCLHPFWFSCEIIEVPYIQWSGSTCMFRSCINPSLSLFYAYIPNSVQSFPALGELYNKKIFKLSIYYTSYVKPQNIMYSMANPYHIRANVGISAENIYSRLTLFYPTRDWAAASGWQSNWTMDDGFDTL